MTNERHSMEREALAEKLAFLLWNRGNMVNEWPHDEAEAYREFGWAEGIAAARKIMFQNAADDLIAAGYRRQTEPREVTTVEELDALPEYVVVFDKVHGVARKLGHEWSLDGMNGWWPSEQLEIRYGLPLTIIFTPIAEEAL